MSENTKWDRYFSKEFDSLLNLTWYDVLYYVSSIYYTDIIISIEDSLISISLINYDFKIEVSECSQ